MENSSLRCTIDTFVVRLTSFEKIVAIAQNEVRLARPPAILSTGWRVTRSLVELSKLLSSGFFTGE